MNNRLEPDSINRIRNTVTIVAEMSANHCGDFERAVKIVRAAKDAGADAIKLQTYTPDTMTLRCDNEYFLIKGTLWDGRTLHDLYREAQTPWEWHPRLKAVADEIELDFFSTPFDNSAVDFLEDLGVPCHKVASFELVDIPLLRKIGRTGKPVIASTGMATLGEIEEAVTALQQAGASEITLLKCVSAYPAPPEEMNLRTIPHMAQAFGLRVGLSDHTPGIAVPVAAVSLGARMIEKHLILSRSDPSPDAAFSLEPHEFKAMVEAVRTTEEALGVVHYGLTRNEVQSRVFRRSLFVTKDIKIGEVFTKHNVSSIRPGYGLHPRHLEDVVGRRAARAISPGAPLMWDDLGGAVDE